MAISTYRVYLMHKSGNTYTRLIDIKDFPDLIGTPDAIETTTLSDSAKTYIPGIKQQDQNLSFKCNYSASDFSTLQALEGTEGEFAIYFGEDGASGKFSFKGYPTVSLSGGSVNEVVEMTLNIAPSTPVTFSAT